MKVILLLLGFYYASIIGSAIAYADSSRTAPQEVNDASNAPAKKPSTPNYARYNPKLTQFCLLLAADGRRDYLVARLEPGMERDPACLGCRPFIKTLVDNCRPPKVRKEKKSKPVDAEGEEESVAPTSTPLPVPQREPSLALTEIVSDLFRAMAEDKKNAAANYQAVQKFSALLIAPGEKTVVVEKGQQQKVGDLTPGTKDYFSVLLSFVHAPFSDLVAEQQRERKRSQNRPGSGASATHGDPDEVFDF